VSVTECQPNNTGARISTTVVTAKIKVALDTLNDNE
jgi:hypothetical protein